MSIFTDNNKRYAEAGYSTIPIMPGAKRPGFLRSGMQTGLGRWAQFCETPATQKQLLEWTNKFVEAGIGVALGYNNVVGIDLDYGTGDVLAAIEEHIPHTDFIKRGQKGYTAFFRTNEKWPSRIFNIPKTPIEYDDNGRLKEESVCEVLSVGRQSVLPPTIHPGTGKAYEWDDLPLSAINPADLPLLPDDFIANITDALRKFGYTPTIAKIQTP
ncbi:bifunctional DNA primase/polymerase, partial [Yoonia sp.]|uniref:bifunctional DNA primase/polymerase n=1 Tax=Yoonia sp. TaxID=2212373 RepID=UPI0023947E85